MGAGTWHRPSAWLEFFADPGRLASEFVREGGRTGGTIFGLGLTIWPRPLGPVQARFVLSKTCTDKAADVGCWV